MEILYTITYIHVILYKCEDSIRDYRIVKYCYYDIYIANIKVVLQTVEKIHYLMLV